MTPRLSLYSWILFLFVGSTACVTTPPPHPRALENNELCAQYISAGDLTKAEIHCDLGLQFSSQYADLWVNKGIIFLRREQKERAKECFIKALRFNQEQAQAYNDLGYIYLQEKSYGRAHDNFQRALKVHPDYVEARHNLALAYLGMGQKDKARKEFRTLIAINPNLAEPHQYLGVMAFEEGNYDESIDELTKAVQADPKYADAWLNLGNAYAEAGKFPESKDAYTSCLEVDPKNIECRNNIPVVVRKGALLDPSLKEITANQETENTPEALYALGRKFLEKGLRNEAERSYKKSLRLDPRYAPSHYGMFELFVEDRRDKEATIACENFLKYALADEFPNEVERCDKHLHASAP